MGEQVQPLQRIDFAGLVAIEIPENRTRTVNEQGVIDLAKSIFDTGLIYPIWVTRQNTQDGKTLPYRLVVGEHRLRAFQHLNKLNPDVALAMVDGRSIPRGYIPVLLVEDNPQVLSDMEVHENLYRIELTWDDRVRILASYHAHELMIVGSDSTVLATAKKLASSTGRNEETVRKDIAQALLLAPHLDTDSDISKASSRREAWNLLKTRASAALAATVTVPAEIPHTFIQGDCTVHLPTLPDETFDALLFDPPYGVDADKWTMKSGMDHQYKDDPATAFGVILNILTDGYRITKPQANFICFCDVRMFNDIRTIANNSGWTCWPKPLIWRKGNEGARPWGQVGFAYTYEAMIFGTKGEKGLTKTSIDIFDCPKVSPATRVHPAEKPVQLLVDLLRIISRPGDKILDPCCGSGAIFRAGYLTGTLVTGIERDSDYYPHCRNALVPPDFLNEPEANGRSLDELL